MAELDTAYQNLRIAFAGTPDFAAEHLRALLEADANIVGVYTQPDRPAGRGKKLMPSPVKTLAVASDIPIFQPQKLKDIAEQEAFAALTPDVFVVVAYGLIIPKAVLTIPTFGCINVHASLLPRWRGAAPIQRAIESGDMETGVTIMQMDVGLDTGDMLETVRCDISPFETGGSLHDKLLRLGPPALINTLNNIATNKLAPERQQDEGATYASKITKQEAAINWQRPAKALEQQIRAFNPFPVCHSQFDEKQVRIWAAHAANKTSQQPPGTIIAVTEDALEVACGEQVLVITEIQLPGKKRLDVAGILRGNAQIFTPGSCFSGAIND